MFKNTLNEDELESVELVCDRLYTMARIGVVVEHFEAVRELIALVLARLPLAKRRVTLEKIQSVSKVFEPVILEIFKIL